MLQPIAVLREAGVNGWWLCVQNSRYSDTLLVPKEKSTSCMNHLLSAHETHRVDSKSSGT